MEEIKVGYFIRTNKGIIGKLKRIELDEIDKNLKWYVFDKKRPDMNIVDEIYIKKPYITKYSKNIIDLIECGDYVNGELVSSIYDIVNSDCESIGKKITTKYRTAQFTGLDINYYIYAEDIKTILTHEQYNVNCYKVKGE